MKFWTSEQTSTALRYAGSAAGGVGGFLALIGIIPHDQAHAFVESLQNLMTHLQLVVGDLYVIAGIVGPGLAVWVARVGIKRSAPSAQAAAVQHRDDTQVLTTNPEIAAADPGIKLVPALPPTAGEEKK